jgi:hypothetical protein
MGATKVAQLPRTYASEHFRIPWPVLDLANEYIELNISLDRRTKAFDSP